MSKFRRGPTDKQRELINKCLLGAVKKKGGWPVIDRMPIWEVNEWVTESLAELKAERKRPPQTPAGPVSQQSPAGQDPAAAAHSADNSNIPHEAADATRHATQHPPTEGQMHELRRQGFDDDEFRGKNSEEAEGMIRLRSKGWSVKKVMQHFSVKPSADQLSTLTELGRGNCTPANYVEAEGIIGRLERKCTSSKEELAGRVEASAPRLAPEAPHRRHMPASVQQAKHRKPPTTGPSEGQRRLINQCLQWAVRNRGGWPVIERMTRSQVSQWMTECMDILKAGKERKKQKRQKEKQAAAAQ